MKRMDACNPIAVFFCFFFCISIPMLSVNPLVTAVSLSFSVLFRLIKKETRQFRFVFFSLLLIIPIGLINPLFSHNGKTVLFVLNNNPITWQATFYGLTMGAGIMATVLWLSCFQSLFTSEKWMYLFGKISPKLSFLLSMLLRYVPLFTKQAEQTKQAQKAIGLYSARDKGKQLRSDARVFSAVSTWALENGIITADSMEARGYSIGNRTHYSQFRFRGIDIFLMIFALIGGFFCLCCILGKKFSFSFYPACSSLSFDAVSLCGYLLYGTICFLPSLFEIGDTVKWKYYISKI